MLMDNKAPFSPSSSPTLDLSTRLPPSASGAALRFWGSLCTVFSYIGLPGHPICASSDIDSYDSVNWGIFVLGTVCFATMAGCGVLSAALLRRRGKKPPSERKTYRKVSTGTVTSSEDEDDDRHGALAHGIEATGGKKKRFMFRQQKPSTHDITTDPGLLRKHSAYVSYTTSRATYSSVRTFFCQHPHMDKLPSKPAPMPLLVFVHGLGGSLAQFHPLLTSLSNVGPCFGIDLPGCGLSSFSPASWEAYTIEALAELLITAIEKYRDREAGQGVVLIGHSLGCSLSALIASSTSPVSSELQKHIVGLIAVCPRASPPSPEEAVLFRRLLWVPGPIFDLWRWWDRRGGPKSKSVSRFVGKDADPDTRELQVRFNKQSKTPVWRRMAWGSLPTYENGKAIGGIPGEDIWTGVQTPVLLVAGEADAITKPTEIESLLEYFGGARPDTRMKATGSTIVPDASRVQDQSSVPYDRLAHEEEFGLEISNGETILPQGDEEKQTCKRRRLVKTTILPAPASHALLYDRATYRTLAGVIQDFLFRYVDHRLNLGWQLQHLNTSGKWDVKNLAKWKKVQPVSEPIADTFVALKMLREVDEEHNPVLFSEKLKDRVYAVIDISHENPVYDPAQLEKGGIHYHKHPTVSKIPPTPDETRDFIALVDRLQSEIDDKMEKRGDSKLPRPLVGVHCHYGFNRTGFLIVCYLIERKGFSVQGAIDEFERCRPPGIRHEHFIDTLFVRYCIGLKRAPTL
ncbi:hypothetical protein VTN00DRAFT_549 [Thermoascus crustaceus]|uniref:uncharacterized protein n=1 Tax=Thermoascus crustaceus TaxID=5088 RepID=UPI003742736E